MSDDDAVTFINSSRSVHGMYKNANGDRYRDKCSLFRCLSYTLYGNLSQRNVNGLMRDWQNYMTRNNMTDSLHLPSEIARFEDCFLTAINIHALERNQVGAFYARPTRWSKKSSANSMNVILHNNHYSLITNFDALKGYWACETCERIFRKHRKYERHQAQCDPTIRVKYVGGGFGNPPNIFDRLLDVGINVQDRFYPFRIVYDFECRFEGNESVKSGNITFENTLIPISVSILSNLGAVDNNLNLPVCFVEENPSDLIAKFIDHLLLIGSISFNVMSTRFQQQLSALRDKPECMELYGTLLRWLRQIPVIGFNSGRFDINLIRRYLIPEMINRKIKILRVIKRGSTYIAIVTEPLVFLDITCFLAGGISYAKWIAGFGVTAEKGVFPYEWLTSYEKLNQDHLPSHSQFFSSLKQSNITAEEYTKLQELWLSHGFRTMKDLLVYYNNMDVVPFLEAAQKMWDIFREMNIDMFKSGCVSLPGLAMLHMFDIVPPDTIFQLYGKQDSKYHDLVKQNIVGGPSIIFNRCSIAGFTKMQASGQDIQTVEGYDCNALYLSTFMYDMPTGLAGYWESITDNHEQIPTDIQSTSLNMEQINSAIQSNMKIILKKTAPKFVNEIACVNYIFNKLQKDYPSSKMTLNHAFNGKQKVFTVDNCRIPVDGWIPEIGTIIQYHGCYYHGHICYLTKSAQHDWLHKQATKTQMVRNLLSSTGHSIIECYECEFLELQRDPSVKRFVDDFHLPSKHLRYLTGHKILERVLRNQFFGMIEVDVQVPFWDENLRNKMSEFPPIFKNATVRIQDIGETMQNVILNFQSNVTKRRCLISSFFGNRILLPTPVLKWMLEHGLVVTNVYCAM